MLLKVICAQNHDPFLKASYEPAQNLHCYTSCVGYHKASQYIFSQIFLLQNVDLKGITHMFPLKQPLIWLTNYSFSISIPHLTLLLYLNYNYTRQFKIYIYIYICISFFTYIWLHDTISTKIIKCLYFAILFFPGLEKYEAYRLTVGTATGTTLAPTYANFVMGFLETNLYNLVLEKFGGEAYQYVSKNCLRFLDDAFIMWKQYFAKISEFINILNTLNDNSNLLMKSVKKKIAFLNVSLYKENGKIHTYMYYKPTDSQDYLPFKSYHPRHVKANIPYTLARIIYTILSDPIRRQYRFNELTDWLRKGDYPHTLIFTAYNSFRGMDFGTK
jgi:hypothetical protein